MVRFIRALALVCVSAFLPGCSNGGGSGSGGSNSFSGTVLGPFGAGLQGAVVQVIGAASTAQAVTDASGNFIVLRPPTGLVDLHIDGSNVPGGTFASLELTLVVGGGASNLSQPIVLPDLGAGTTMSVPVDANGETLGAMTVVAPDGSALTIPDMTTILVDGAIPSGTVDVNVTPVDAINVPMPLPGTQDAGAFVTIQPPGAAFSPALDITLPNARGFPLGTMVDIWSFDHDEGAWVNRSDETGNQGTVVDLGGMEFIVASGVITEGGWHAGTLPVDPSCATTLEGEVRVGPLVIGPFTPLEDVLISLSTGQFARTDADGHFRIASVPAYDASMLPGNCVAGDVQLRAIAPVSFGAVSVSGTIPAGTIVTGGTTNLVVGIPVTSTGSLVGSVTDGGQGVEGTVSLSGTSELEVDTDENGSFFLASLHPGPYMASFPFDNGVETEDFTIHPTQTTVVSLTAGPPSPQGALSVLVLDFSEGNGIPVQGAWVTLVGASGAPLSRITGVDGKASFASAPSGPYSVTAQKDTTIPTGIGRLAVSLVGVNPTGRPRVIAIPLFDDGGFRTPVTADATLQGTVQNPPKGADLRFQIETNAGSGFGTGSTTVSGTSFQADIPAGLPLDVAVWATDTLSGRIVSAVFAPGVSAASGQTLMLDFDFASACLFDQPVTASYANAQPQDILFADLELRGNGALSFPFSDGTGLPTTFDWPDFSSAKLASFDPFFAVGSEQLVPNPSESSCDRPLGHTTPSSLSIRFRGVPEVLFPVIGVDLTSYGPGDTVQYTLGSDNGTTTGFNSIVFAGQSGSSGVFSFWNLLVPAATTTVTLPPVFPGKPMFSEGAYVVSVEAMRFPFPGFDFATVFDQDLPSVVAAIQASEICGGVDSDFFFVCPPCVGALGLTAVDREQLRRRAERAGGLRWRSALNGR